MFSINVLLYGDYPALARRVLCSLLLTPRSFVTDIRIGLNAVSAQTRELAFGFCQQSFVQSPCYIYEPLDGQNVGKYPLMRRMFYDERRPLASKIMWFDDDSYLANADMSWWNEAAAESDKYVVMGARHFIRPRGNQWEGVRAQPWYSGLPLTPTGMFSFITGGWWTAQTEFLHAWDYPFLDLHHNGGDSILGELARQRSQPLGVFAKQLCHCPCDGCTSRVKLSEASANLVHINHADRRGVGSSRAEERYIWQEWPNDVSGQLQQHSFECSVFSFI